MVSVIRMLTEGDAKDMWAAIVDRKDALQSALGKKGRLLYLTKRADFNEASLFVHANDSNSVSELAIGYLAKIEGVSAVSTMNLYRPRFFPVPEDTSDLKRFVVAIKAEPSCFSEVHKQLINPNMPDGLRKVYYAFTLQHAEDDLHCSLLAEDEDRVQEYVDRHITTMNGIVSTEIHVIEKTKPFISYHEWLSYVAENNSMPAWHRYMENHFESSFQLQ
ncbi:hypothetical protein ACFL43_03100 [Thermodesulfobacteriota bacterium]